MAGMSSQRSCDDGDVAPLIRAVYPRDTMKRLARLMNVPLDTARHWLYRHFSAERRRELCLKLIAELNEQDRRREAVRTQLNAIAGGANAQVGDVPVGAAPRRPRPHQRRAAAG